MKAPGAQNRDLAQLLNRSAALTLDTLKGWRVSGRMPSVTSFSPMTYWLPQKGQAAVMAAASTTSSAPQFLQRTVLFPMASQLGAS